MDDSTATQMDEVVASSVDIRPMFQHVQEKLGGSSLQSSDGILWEPVTERWILVRPLTNSRSKGRRDERDSPIQTPSLPIAVRVKSHDEKKGFTSYQYVSGETDIIGITSTVYGDDAFTYITVYDSKGTSIMPQTYVGPIKYDGMLVIRTPQLSNSSPFVATFNSDNTLTQRERQIREKIETLQQKYSMLKDQELAEQKM